MKKNKYLDDLGIKRKDYNYYNIRNLKRKLKLLNQRRKYGFDETEVWNLDLTYIEWLYSHLMMYKEINHCDLKAPVNKISYHTQECKLKDITMEEALDFMITELATYLKSVYLEEGLSFEPPRPELYDALCLFANTFRFWWD